MVDTVSQVAALLRGDKPDAAPETETAELRVNEDPEKGQTQETEQETAPAVQHRKLDELAKTHKLSVEELYATEIPLTKDKAFTLGEIKDRFRELTELDAERSAFTDGRSKAEQRLIQQRMELQAGMALLGPRMTAADFEQLKPRLEQARETERKAALDVIPDWSDDNRRNADLEMISKAGAKWGFSEAEIRNTLEFDHRAAAWLRHLVSREVQAAKIVAEKPKKLGAAPGGAREVTGAARLSQMRKQVAEGKLDPVRFVSDLLRSNS